MARIAIAVLILSLAACASLQPPALHVIGVYEGQPVPGTDTRDWPDKCGNLSLDDCFRTYAGERGEKEVRVTIIDNRRPIVLVLSAYDKTQWKLDVGSGVHIQKVVIGGYHTQSVTGLEPGTPIEIYSHEASPCDSCFQSPKYFFFYEAPPVELLRETTGLKVTTFQGRYSGTEFSIFPGMNEYESK